MTAQRTPLSYKREWPGTKMRPQMVTILVTLLLQCPQGLHVGIFRVTAGVGVAACPAAVGLPVAPVIPLALACGGGGRGQQRRGLLPELGAPGTALSLLPR